MEMVHNHLRFQNIVYKKILEYLFQMEMFSENAILSNNRRRKLKKIE